METYVREHHTQLRRRLESVKRIHKASDTVETRLKELTIMQGQLSDQHAEFSDFKNDLTTLLSTSDIDAETDNESGDNDKETENSNVLYWDHKVS